MNRRQFLKRAGIGAAAIASVPTLGPALLNALARPAWAGGGETGFHFQATVKKGTPPSEVIIFSGAGVIDDDDVEGGGSFTHFDNTTSTPKTILGFGTWEARRLLSFNQIGTYGAFAAGVLEMEVRLRPEEGDRIEGATMKVVCNIGPAGLSTGEEEGLEFVLGGDTFTPLAGLTIFIADDED